MRTRQSVQSPRKISSSIAPSKTLRAALDQADPLGAQPDPDAAPGAVAAVVLGGDQRARPRSRTRAIPPRDARAPCRGRGSARPGSRPRSACAASRRAPRARPPARSAPGSSRRCGPTSTSASSWSWVTNRKVIPSALLQVLELDLHLVAQLGVERRHRLVEQQHLGLEHERARERHALLLAARELGDAARAEARRGARARAPAPTRALDLGRLEPAQLEPEGDVARRRVRCGKSA